MYVKLRESSPYYLQRVPLTQLQCYFPASVHVLLCWQGKKQILLLGAWNSCLVLRVFGLDLDLDMG